MVNPHKRANEPNPAKMAVDERRPEAENGANEPMEWLERLVKRANEPTDSLFHNADSYVERG